MGKRMRCGDCKYFQPAPKCLPYGHCSRWHESYHIAPPELKLNEVVVEIDEGWGNMVGPDFGCVLFEEKE